MMKDSKYLKLKKDIDSYVLEIENIFAENYNVYIEKKKITEFKNKYEYLYKKISDALSFYMFIKKYLLTKKLKSVEGQVINLSSNVRSKNEITLTNMAAALDKEFKLIEGNSIDRYQLNSILVDASNVLVIAGAGTGKTTTILAKIKYLLLKSDIDPKDLLVLTYTNASSKELKSKIKNESNVDLDVFTFHKLGRNIIAEVSGKAPTLTNIDMMSFIRENILDLITNDNKYLEQLVDYLIEHQYLLKSNFEFDSLSDYNEYIRLNPTKTLKNETVKSQEEVKIANFLFKNNINYIYEQKYIMDTEDGEYSGYRPDFYLPDYKIWIEHFSIDENNNVPRFFEATRGKSAKQIYNDAIVWKRNIHKQNGTTLVETYSYENKQGKLLENLEKKLKKYNVIFEEIDNRELFKRFEKENKAVFNGFNELFSTVISLVRVNGYSYGDFSSMVMDKQSHELRKLILPILERYIKILNDFGEIDFTDMLNIATEYIKDGKYNNKYKYVIVDEYQDMSKSTFNFLRALRESSPYKMFCVGDDWQSIYRFAGSNVNYITYFENYFGSAELFFIPITYRFNQSIANISTNFIMENKNQISKQIYSNKENNDFSLGLIESYTDRHAIIFMEEKLKDLPLNSNVMFLGRYNYDIKGLNNNFNYIFDQRKQVIKVKYKQRTDLNIEFRTVHTAKGLESDYVFVLNNKIGSYGFPSEIQDNKIINYFLEQAETFPHSEERRLFYVAITRAKNKVWLLVNENKESVFINELKLKYSIEIKKEKYLCPKCGEQLRIINGKNGTFWGCSNYPNCRHTKNIAKSSSNNLSNIE